MLARVQPLLIMALHDTNIDAGRWLRLSDFWFRPVVLDIRVGDVDSGSTLSKFADDTMLCGGVKALEGRDAIQRDLDRLQRQAFVSLMKFIKAKHTVQHMSWGNLKHKYMLGKEWIGSSLAEKDLEVLVDEKLNMTWQCALAAQKPTISWTTPKAAWSEG
ncbi:rna-directed dna polymerase from mobile element jockey-like [Pitangus sulphuratus]|nr:rna-directed dna polymerase from mobile element jockey-like [Pitangus sulphuratus]